MRRLSLFIVCVTCFTLVTQSALARPLDTAPIAGYENSRDESFFSSPDEITVPVPGSEETITLPLISRITYQSTSKSDGGYLAAASFKSSKKYGLFYCLEIPLATLHTCTNSVHKLLPNYARHNFEYVRAGLGANYVGLASDSRQWLGSVYRSTFLASTFNTGLVEPLFKGGQWTQIYQPMFHPTLNSSTSFNVAASYSGGNQYVGGCLQPSNGLIQGWFTTNSEYNPHDCVTCQCETGLQPKTVIVVYGLESDSDMSEVASLYKSLDGSESWSNDFEPINGGEYVIPKKETDPVFEDNDPWGGSVVTSNPAVPSYYPGTENTWFSGMVDSMVSAITAAASPVTNLFGVFDGWQDLSGRNF